MDKFCKKEDMISELYVICLVVLRVLKMGKAHGLLIKKYLAEKTKKPVHVDKWTMFYYMLVEYLC